MASIPVEPEEGGAAYPSLFIRPNPPADIDGIGAPALASSFFISANNDGNKDKKQKWSENQKYGQASFSG